MITVEAQNPAVVNSPAIRQGLKDSLAAWFVQGGHTTERKIARLTEKLKDLIEASGYGPLFEGDGVTRTRAGEIFKDFQDIYSQDFLDQFDEEGNLR